MILKALYDYYYRLGTLPPAGAELKEIEFIIVIDREGRFKRFESTRIDKKKCTSFIVPKGVSRTSAPKANALWDNGKYVLGLDPANESCNLLFIEKVERIANDNPEEHSMQALKAFYAADKESMIAAMAEDPLFDEVKERQAANFSFQLEGEDRLIAEKLDLVKIHGESSDDVPTGVCLITGNRAPLVRLTTATPIPGNSPMATLVGMQTNSGYDSYGKSQAYNAPISEEAEFAFSSALKALLSKDSVNKFKVGDRLFLFWGSNSNEVVKEVEESFFDFYNLEFEKKDDPNEKLSKIDKLMKNIWSGEEPTQSEDRFYALGLAPNTGRIAVVEWNDLSIKEFAHNMLQHFQDMHLKDYRKENKRRPYSGLYTMLSAITLSGKANDAPSHLVEGTLKAIITATRYPFALYTSTLERIRGDMQEYPVPISRAAILKAYINRATKFQNNIKPLNDMIDTTNDNPGYLCGRLAAVLEQMQSAVNGGDSIRTTYLTAASATPASVYPSMLALSNHHSDKLSTGNRIFYERLKQEIIALLPSSGFPARLDLMDQGRFFVGYYHQRCEFFTKKDNKKEENDTIE